MKLGIFLPHIDPESGGAFTFAETVISGLFESGLKDEVVVYHYGSAGKLAEAHAGKVGFRSLAGSKFSGSLRRAWCRITSCAFQKLSYRLRQTLGVALPFASSSPLDRATRRDGIDLVWFPTTSFEPLECPYIFTVWDLEHRAQPFFPEISANGEWEARENFFRRALGRAAYVITGTRVGAREIREFFGVDAKRIRLLPHPTPRFALAARTEIPLPESLNVREPYVLYPAQFWAHKNHIGLVEAVAALRDRGVRVDCAFLGSDKGNRAYVEARVRKLKLEDRVRFLGFVSRDELVSLYQHATAMVYPSLCGPENLPPLEAMAIGCPVVAAEIEGSREQLGEAAVLVDALDPNALAGAIGKLASDPNARRTLVEKGKTRAASYTDKHFVRDLSMILDEFRTIRARWK